MYYNYSTQTAAFPLNSCIPYYDDSSSGGYVRYNCTTKTLYSDSSCTTSLSVDELNMACEYSSTYDTSYEYYCYYAGPSRERKMISSYRNQKRMTSSITNTLLSRASARTKEKFFNLKLSSNSNIDENYNQVNSELVTDNDTYDNVSSKLATDDETYHHTNRKLGSTSAIVKKTTGASCINTTIIYYYHYYYHYYHYYY